MGLEWTSVQYAVPKGGQYLQNENSNNSHIAKQALGNDLFYKTENIQLCNATSTHHILLKFKWWLQEGRKWLKR